jgi:hypothetical protein
MYCHCKRCPQCNLPGFASVFCEAIPRFHILHGFQNMTGFILTDSINGESSGAALAIDFPPKP